MAKKKVRADQRLVDLDLVADLKEGQALIMAGKVFTEKEEKIYTAGQAVSTQVSLYVKGADHQFVGRGGYKLDHALDIFSIDLTGKVSLDIGSSTGGFTDVMLQRGAQPVYALDVGTNQLAWSLRSDPRVVVMEQTNFRYSQVEDFTSGQPEFASIDVSFISLKLILPVLADILKKGGECVALIKPQFEADRDQVGDHGVVSDPEVHAEVLDNIIQFAKKDYQVLNLAPSPITGREGNREFLLYLSLKNNPTDEHLPARYSVEEVVSRTIENSH